MRNLLIVMSTCFVLLVSCGGGNSTGPVDVAGSGGKTGNAFAGQIQTGGNKANQINTLQLYRVSNTSQFKSSFVRDFAVDFTGRFGLSGLDSGLYNIIGYAANGSAVAYTNLRLKNDTTAHLGQLSVKKTGSLQGSVRLYNLPKATFVSTIYLLGTPIVEVTESNGDFTISDIPEGTYTIVADYKRLTMDYKPTGSFMQIEIGSDTLWQVAIKPATATLADTMTIKPETKPYL